jgi:hypothetical protein
LLRSFPFCIVDELNHSGMPELNIRHQRFAGIEELRFVVRTIDYFFNLKQYFRHLGSEKTLFQSGISTQLLPLLQVMILEPQLTLIKRTGLQSTTLPG